MKPIRAQALPLRQLVLAALLLAAATPLAAQSVPSTLNYQGRLTDNSPQQNPIDGTIPMKFAIYDGPNPATATLLWEEPSQTPVAQGLPVVVSKGVFSVVLGANGVPIPSSVFAGASNARYLLVTLQPAGTPEPLLPPQVITSTGFTNIAQNAYVADTAASATTAGSATNFTGPLAGDVTGTQGATVVSSVGGKSASAVATSVDDTQAATSTNTVSTIVRRDGSGNFAAGTITGNLVGNASTATSTTNFSGSLAGDVTGTQGATVVANVGGQTASNVASGAQAANAATSTNTASTIVRRDGSGNFAAGTITGNLVGNASTATSTTNFSGSLAGDVTGTQGATVVSSVGGKSASAVATSVDDTLAATTASTPNTLVRRDGAGAIPGANNSGVAVNTTGTVSVTDGGGTKTSAEQVWRLGLDSLAATGTFGTSSNNHVDFYTNNLVRGRLSNLGEFFIGTTNTVLAGDLMNGVSNATFPWAVNGYSGFNGSGVFGQITGGTTVYAAVQGENSSTSAGIFNAAGVRGMYEGSASGTGLRILAATGPNVGVIGNQTATTCTYCFGVYGAFSSTSVRAGAVFGDDLGIAMGAIGYYASNLVDYAVYGFGGAYQTGTSGGLADRRVVAGVGPTAIANQVGLGMYGNVMGGWLRGGVYGAHVRGERSSLYVDGRSFANQPTVNLVDTGADRRAVTWTVSSPSPDLFARGRARLSAGKATVTVDAGFRAAVARGGNLAAAADGVTITVTPLGPSKGIYLAGLTADGFEVRENGDGTSDVEVSWIAVGTRIDVDTSMPEEVLSSKFDANMRRAMADGEHSEPEGAVWWDGQAVRFDTPERPLLTAPEDQAVSNSRTAR